MTRWASLTMAVALTSLLGGCADKPPAVIENKSVPAAIETPEVRQATAPERAVVADVGQMLQRGPNYIVQPGDTLYAVAFRLGMDYRTLAEINNIDPPYVIRVSQSLKTIGAGSRALDDTAAVAPTQSVVVEPDRFGSPPWQTSTASAGQQVEAVRPEPGPGPPSHTLSTGKSATPKGPVDRWIWPAAGAVSRPFSGERHKGIDLAGQRGAPVMATAPGVVVYAGTGVTGYGALLILKHNDTYLSAYGHNDELLAVEGEQVKAGQVIARMGSTDSDSVKLHFEIRRDGRPVNPTGLLPSR